MENILRDDERLDYLLAEGLRIIQSPSVFSFSLDAVLLAKFAYVPIRKGKIVDLCAGNGARTNAEITAVELQERLANMAERSICYNGLENRIHVVNDDVINIASRLGYERYDTVTCNPPYFPAHEASEKNLLEPVAIARHEIRLNLEQAIQSASELLKQGGKAAFVHRPGRLLDIVTAMRANLIEGIKDGKPDLKILPPLYVYGADGAYTEEVRQLLYGQEN